MSKDWSPVEYVRGRTAEVGGKSANLEALGLLSEESKDFNNGAPLFEVPDFNPLSTTDVSEFLTRNSCDLPSLWDEFVEKMPGSLAGNGITDDAKEILGKIREKILAAFERDDTVFDSLLKEVMRDDELWAMVRSTGAEDGDDISNAGGNESLPSKLNDLQALKRTIAKVIASYFGEKSFSQRALSGESLKSLCELPIVPCLIQDLIGEGQNAGNETVPFSGVVYSGGESVDDETGELECSVKIDYALGHGGYVVDAKGPMTSLDITTDGAVFKHRSKQESRLVVQVAGEDPVRVKNSIAQQSAQLYPGMVERIRKTTAFLEKRFGKRVDVEIVCDGDKLYVVQVRPIPLPKIIREPSALNPEYVKLFPKQKGEVVTQRLNHAVIIKERSQLLVCETLEEAFSKYEKLAAGEKPLAVVIKRPSVSGSHFANEFDRFSVPVLYMPTGGDIVEEWNDLLADGQALVVNPQLSSVHFIQDNVEDYNQLVKTGLFKSTKTGHVDVGTEPRELTKRERSLLSAYQISSKSYEEKKLHAVLESAEEVEAMLERFSTPNGLAVGIVRKRMLELCSIASSLRQAETVDKKHSEALIQKIELTGAALLDALGHWQQSTGKVKENAYSEYLDIHKKLEGLFLSEEQTGVISSSVKREFDKVFRRGKYLDKKAELGVNFISFCELAENESRIVIQDKCDDWVQFCYDFYRSTPSRVLELDELVSQLKELGLFDYWVNVEFPTVLNELRGEKSEVVFNKLLNNLEEGKQRREELIRAKERLDELEYQIDDFASPDKFDSLLENLKETIFGSSTKVEGINSILHQDDAQETVLNLTFAVEQSLRMVEIVDKSIKALQTSGEYVNKVDQVKNYRKLIEQFFRILEENAPQDRQIQQNLQYYRNKLTLLVNESSSQMGVSAEFSGLATNLLEKPTTVARGMENLNWLGDFHIAVHTSNSELEMRRAFPLNEMLVIGMPKQVRKFDEQLRGFKFAGGAAKQVQAKFCDEKVILRYNLPLAYHAMVLDVVFDPATNKATLTADLFGKAFEEHDRWSELAYMFLGEAMSLDLDILSCTANNSSAKFEFELDVTDTGKVAQTLALIKEICEQSTKHNKKEIKKCHDALKEPTSVGFHALCSRAAGGFALSYKIRRLMVTESEKESLSGIQAQLEAKEVPTEQIYNGLALYKDGFITDDMLQVGDDERLKLYCSDGFLLLYSDRELRESILALDNQDLMEITQLTVAQSLLEGLQLQELLRLKTEQPEWFNKLTNESALSCYKSGIPFTDLLQVVNDNDAYKALTSEKAVKCYRAGISFGELEEIYKDDLKLKNGLLDALLKQSAIDSYKNGIRPRDFKEVFEDKVLLKALQTRDANRCYQAGVLFEELKTAYTEMHQEEGNKLALLMSDEATECYQAGKTSFEELRICSPAEIKVKIASILFGMEDKVEELTDLIQVDEEKFGVLFKTSYRMNQDMRAYYAKKGVLGFDDLKEMPVELIRIFTSNSWLNYNIADFNPKPDVVQLKQKYDEQELSAEQLNELVSHNAVQCYQLDVGPNFEQLEKYNPEKIKLLVSMDAVRVYKDIDSPSFSDLASLDARKIELLTGFYAKEFYKDKALPSFDELVDFTPAQLVVILENWNAKINLQKLGAQAVEYLQQFSAPSLTAILGGRGLLSELSPKTKDFKDDEEAKQFVEEMQRNFFFTKVNLRGFSSPEGIITPEILEHLAKRNQVVHQLCKSFQEGQTAESETISVLLKHGVIREASEKGIEEAVLILAAITSELYPEEKEAEKKWHELLISNKRKIAAELGTTSIVEHDLFSESSLDVANFINDILGIVDQIELEDIQTQFDIILKKYDVSLNAEERDADIQCLNERDFDLYCDLSEFVELLNERIEEVRSERSAPSKTNGFARILSGVNVFSGCCGSLSSRELAEQSTVDIMSRFDLQDVRLPDDKSLMHDKAEARLQEMHAKFKASDVSWQAKNQARLVEAGVITDEKHTISNRHVQKGGGKLSAR